MARTRYEDSVFINCPFDTEYGALLDAIIFVVQDCGFVARCALEVQDTGQVRLARILELIANCKYGIHDISRTELDPINRLPRFNMPLELGLFLGARSFGSGRHKSKVCLVLDTEPYRYQKFCSDIAGQDPAAHGGEPATAITVVRNWLRSHSKVMIPGGVRIAQRYAQFRIALPDMCGEAGLDPTALTFADYSALVEEWLREHLERE